MKWHIELERKVAPLGIKPKASYDAHQQPPFFPAILIFTMLKVIVASYKRIAVCSLSLLKKECDHSRWSRSCSHGSICKAYALLLDTGMDD